MFEIEWEPCLAIKLAEQRSVTGAIDRQFH